VASILKFSEGELRSHIFLGVLRFRFQFVGEAVGHIVSLEPGKKYSQKAVITEISLKLPNGQVVRQKAFEPQWRTSLLTNDGQVCFCKIK
jgi:hypothetical protein